jgi:O-succinylbenzoic acid--CoA ligase
MKPHKSFQLNGNSFENSNEIINFSKEISGEIHSFLKDWFSNKTYIEVKTSGSTGTPKTIQLKKEFMRNSALATGKILDLNDNTTALLCLSVNYIAGKMMLVRALVLGWQLDVVETNSNPLENSENTYDFSAMVPMQLENSLNKIHQIKKVIVGGGVVSNDLQDKLQHIRTDVFATYGMTETVTHIALKKLNNFSSKSKNIESFYKILPNIKIYKDTRNCLVIDAPKVADEIIFTNDVVDVISDKHFTWLGRFDNVINSGGIKLQPEIIEEKLSKIIKQRFFVAGIPDEKLGEKLILLVEGNLQKINFTQTNLSKYEIPKDIYFVEVFVETETKKIQRNKTLDFIK